MIKEEKERVVHTTCGGKWKMSGLISGDYGVKFIELNRIGADKMVTGNRGSGRC